MAISIQFVAANSSPQASRRDAMRDRWAGSWRPAFNVPASALATDGLRQDRAEGRSSAVAGDENRNVV
jgi:hypothetical protein